MSGVYATESESESERYNFYLLVGVYNDRVGYIVVRGVIYIYGCCIYCGGGIYSLGYSIWGIYGGSIYIGLSASHLRGSIYRGSERVPFERGSRIGGLSASQPSPPLRASRMSYLLRC